MYEPRLYSFFRFFFAWIDRYPMNTTDATTRTTSNQTPWHPSEPSWPSVLAGISSGWRDKGGDLRLIWRLVIDIFPDFVLSVGVMETLSLVGEKIREERKEKKKKKNLLKRLRWNEKFARRWTRKWNFDELAESRSICLTWRHIYIYIFFIFYFFGKRTYFQNISQWNSEILFFFFHSP